MCTTFSEMTRILYQTLCVLFAYFMLRLEVGNDGFKVGYLGKQNFDMIGSKLSISDVRLFTSIKGLVFQYRSVLFIMQKMVNGDNMYYTGKGFSVIEQSKIDISESVNHYDK